MIFTNIILLKLLFPIGSFGLSLWAKGHQTGLFHKIDIPYEFIISLVLFDLYIYFQHVLTHKIPILWRLHRVHHIDKDLDVTSGLRFHPLEIIFSQAYKAVFIIFLGPSPLSVLIFEIILNSMAMFNHSNLALPSKLEKFLRFFIVTPQMHIIHHSVEQVESDTNYGFNLSIWDRLFKTYTDVFKSNGTIGQKNYEAQSLKDMLLNPFK